MLYKQLSIHLRLLTVLAFIFAAGFTQVNAAEEDFTIIALPDTQMYSQNNPKILKAQADWIVAQAEELNIKMVLHEGDVVNKGGNDVIQWPNAKAQLDAIDKAGIPMFIAMGNHDYDDMSKTRNSTWFNRFFGIGRYTGKSWFGGAFEADKSNNVYGFINAGGRDFLVFALEFSPRQVVVSWANQIMAQYPQHDVIIVTHNFLYSDGTHHNRLVQGGTYGISSDAKNGLELWNELINPNANAVMVLNGHVGGDGVAQRTDFATNGNMVHQLETNYQFEGLGGGGYLRIIKFHPSAGVIEVQSYSPYLNQYKTDPDNQFVLPYNPSSKRVPFVTIQGKVRNAAGAGLNALVTLELDGKSLNADYTDVNGSFAFRVLPGNYTVKVNGAPYPVTSAMVAATEPSKEYQVPITMGLEANNAQAPVESVIATAESVEAPAVTAELLAPSDREPIATKPVIVESAVEPAVVVPIMEPVETQSQVAAPAAAQIETQVALQAPVITEEPAQVWAGPATKLPGKLAEGSGNDIVLRNSKLSLVIAAGFEDPQLPGATLGKPVDMAATGLSDGIDWMNFPYLSLQQPIWDNSGSITTIQNKSVRVANLTSEEAVVETEGIYTEVAGITVNTKYSLRPDQEWVEAVSTFTNSTDQDVKVWAGDVMDNDDGKQVVFVPGIGDLGPGTKGRKEYRPTAPWIGHYGDAEEGYAFIYDKEFAGFVDFGANITVMTMKQITIPARGKFELRRYIVVTPSTGRSHKMDAVNEIYQRLAVHN